MKFSKLHGAGNDFVVMSSDDLGLPVTPEFVRAICDRHCGVGADGLIVLEAMKPDDNCDFRMIFHNCDGSRAEMCGNGLRCAASFAERHMGGEKKINFQTDAGTLKTEIVAENSVRIELPVLRQAEELSLDACGTLFFCDTGVPHVVIVVDDVTLIDIVKEGAAIRWHDKFSPDGTNVNFIALPKNENDPIKVRTYERGVENETRACGTGVAACGVSLGVFRGYSSPIDFECVGGDLLSVDFNLENGELSELTLTGPAVEVFRGEYFLCSPPIQ